MPAFRSPKLFIIHNLIFLTFLNSCNNIKHTSPKLNTETASKTRSHNKALCNIENYLTQTNKPKNMCRRTSSLSFWQKFPILLEALALAAETSPNIPSFPTASWWTDGCCKNQVHQVGFRLGWNGLDPMTQPTSEVHWGRSSQYVKILLPCHQSY